MIRARNISAIASFRDRLLHKPELSSAIKFIIVYGSVARGEETENSDIDILVVGGEKNLWEKISEIAHNVDYENNYETFITTIYLTTEEFEHRIKAGSPLIQTILREGVILYDNGTFQRIREEMLRPSK
ncbi:MAG: nucleotidyltransferase domain-containing protein [Candidatus Bathyarchaeia archaeon]